MNDNARHSEIYGKAALWLPILLLLLAACAGPSAYAGPPPPLYAPVATRHDTQPVTRGPVALVDRYDGIVRQYSHRLTFGQATGVFGAYAVGVGDVVYAGQLLATLCAAALEESIAHHLAYMAHVRWQHDLHNSLQEIDIDLQWLDNQHAMRHAADHFDAPGMAAAQAAAHAIDRALLELHMERQRQALDMQLLYNALEALHHQRHDLELRAPFAGTVTYMAAFDAGGRVAPQPAQPPGPAPWLAASQPAIWLAEENPQRFIERVGPGPLSVARAARVLGRMIYIPTAPAYGTFTFTPGGVYALVEAPLSPTQHAHYVGYIPTPAPSPTNMIPPSSRYAYLPRRFVANLTELPLTHAQREYYARFIPRGPGPDDRQAFLPRRMLPTYVPMPPLGTLVALYIYHAWEPDTLRIPINALSGAPWPYGYHVYRIQNGTSIPTPVTVGLQGNAYAQILTGLQEGDEVVVRP